MLAMMQQQIPEESTQLQCGSPLAIYEAMIGNFSNIVDYDHVDDEDDSDDDGNAVVYSAQDVFQESYVPCQPRVLELAEAFKEKPLPKRPHALKNTGRAVAKWLGGLRKMKSHASLSEQADQDAMLWQTKEPTVRRVPSIEQVILA